MRRPVVLVASLAALSLAVVLVSRDGAPSRAPRTTTPPVDRATTSGGPRCDVRARPESLERQFSAALAGEVLCLANGDYGTFTGAVKPRRVTLRGEGEGTRIRLDLRDAVNLAFERLAIPEARLAGTTRRIVIRDSRFSGPVTIDGLRRADVLLERNTHVDIDAGEGSPPARIHLAYSSPVPSGVTVRDSLLAGGDADGIQTGTGMTIVGNRFRDILESGPNHTDAIQLIGAPGTVVRGNSISNSSSGIVAYDGVARALIEDNVIQLPGRPWGIELYTDDGSVVRHNTLPGGRCAWRLPCGIIELSRKPEDPPGRGTVVVDNVATAISVSNGSSLAERRGNLLAPPADRSERDVDDRYGVPRFRGGAAPADHAGFALAAGSPGTGAAPDGSDAGIRPRRD